MPHIVTFDGLIAVEKLNETTNVSPTQGDEIGIVHPAFRSGLISYREDGANRANPTPHPGINPDSMLSLDELTGGFDALNETTNFRLAKGESVSIVHPDFRTGLINPDSMRPIDELTSSFVEKAELMRHAPKDSEYRPQSSIDVVTGKTNSSSSARVIGLQITGEGPDQWIQYDTNDGAVEGKLGPDSMLPIDELTSSFIEKAELMRHAPKDSEYRPQSSIDVVTGKPDSTSTATEIGLQIIGEGRRMNIWGNGGASTLEDRTTSDDDFNDVVLGNGIDPDIQRPTHPNDNNVVNPGSGGTSFITSAIEAPAEMTSFGKSLNPVAELRGTAGLGGTSFCNLCFPANNLTGSADPGGDDV